MEPGLSCSGDVDWYSSMERFGHFRRDDEGIHFPFIRLSYWLE